MGPQMHTRRMAAWGTQQAGAWYMSTNSLPTAGIISDVLYAAHMCMGGDSCGPNLVITRPFFPLSPPAPPLPPHHVLLVSPHPTIPGQGQMLSQQLGGRAHFARAKAAR